MDAKYLDKLLKHEGVANEVVSLAGERSLAVLKLLSKIQDDEKIAKKLNVKVSDVRSVLNKLNQEGIVYYDRTKDPETGWFYYKWVLEPHKLRDWFARKVENRKRFFYALVMDGDHYFCADCGIDSPYSFDIAMDYEFTCPIHQRPMELIDEDVIEKHIKKLPELPPAYEPKQKAVAKNAGAKKKQKTTSQKKAKKPSKKTRPKATPKKAAKKTSKAKKPKTSSQKTKKATSKTAARKAASKPKAKPKPKAASKKPKKKATKRVKTSQNKKTRKR